MAVRTALAPEAREALEAGDIEALLAFHADRFGGWFMEEEGDDDDEGDEDEDEGGDDEGDDEDDDDDSEYEPPTKAEWKKTQDALKKANAQAKKHRLAAKKAASAKDGGADKKDVEKAISDTEAKWRPRLVNKAAKAALLAAGASKPDRLIKLIDHDELDIDDDGEVEGLDDAIEELKEDYPELFKEKDDDDDKPKRRRRPGSADTGKGKQRASGQKKSSADRIAAGLTGTRS